MLTHKNSSKITYPNVITLLFTISLILNHSYASADPLIEAAKNYRDSGYAEQQQGNYEKAIQHYTKAISLGLETAVVYNDLGVLYEELGFDEKAEDAYFQALKKDKLYLPVYSNLAYYFLDRGDKQNAMEFFRRRYELGNPQDTWTQKAKEELLKLNPNFEKMFFYKEVENLDTQVSEQVQKEFHDKVVRSRQHYKRGEQLLDKGLYRESISEFDRALTLMPQDKKAIMARKKAVLELSKQNIQTRSQEAINMLDAGDSISAKRKIQRMLTTMPNEPIIVPR